VEYDIGRTVELEKYGIKVVRFSNNQILNDIKTVIHEIIKICNERKFVINQSPLLRCRIALA
jgi:very-short-patch-repair endonuclease